MPELKELDIIKFRCRHKHYQPGYVKVTVGDKEYWDDIKVACVTGVTDNGDGTITFTYTPHATKEYPDKYWCGHGCHHLPIGEFHPKEYGWQEVEVIDKLRKSPQQEWVEARQRVYSEIYRNPGYDPMM